MRTLKLFVVDGVKLPIRFDVAKNTDTVRGLERLVGKEVTLFWHGHAPTLDSNRQNIFVRAPKYSVYDGGVVKPGHYRPVPIS